MKAAEIYEEIIEHDPSKRLALANRLVKIYGEAGVTNKALKWAEAVMEWNPDPQAYLAGVHAMLGNYGEAREILANELAEVGQSRRRLTLQWQLADVYEKEGNTDKAERILKAAADSVKGKPEEITAGRRLKRFYKHHRSATDESAGTHAEARGP